MGEPGPEQLLQHIEDLALERIAQACHPEPDGCRLRWEQLDPERGLLLRHQIPVGDSLDFGICAGEQGIELHLPDSHRLWVSLQPDPQPPAGVWTRAGWHAATPSLSWHYCQGPGSAGRAVLLAVEWQLAGLAPAWVEAVLERHPELPCHLDAELACVLKPQGEGALRYRGQLPVVQGAGLPTRRRVRLHQPLVRVEVPSGRGEPAAASELGPPSALDAELPLSVTVQDLAARIGDRRTRLVAEEDLTRPVTLELVLPAEEVLPPRLAAGTLPGVPWAIVSADLGLVEGLALTARRWRLTAQPEPDQGVGCWAELGWSGDPPVFRLASRGAPAGTALCRILGRQVRVAWQLSQHRASLLCFTVPRWLPVGIPQPEQLPLEPGPRFDYAPELSLELAGMEERFGVDPGSELPAVRLCLEPDRWRCRDASGAEVRAEALGSAGGYVRWRRPQGEGERPLLPPTEWAAGSAAVLVVERHEERGDSAPTVWVQRWGGLYVPGAVPWNHLREVQPLLGGTPETALLRLRPGSPVVWISLWGFISRYDRHLLRYARAGGERQVCAWVAPGGLPLFPDPSDFLLRSFSPLYAVRVPDSYLFELRPTTPRPTLAIGRDVLAGTGPVSLEPGADTRCRMTWSEGTVPESFPHRWNPGQLWSSREAVGARMLWLALDRPGQDAGGYLLSWDAQQGWRLRGFYADPGAALELGSEPLGPGGAGGLPVRLRADAAGDAHSFTLVLTGSSHRWDPATPEPVRREEARILALIDEDYLNDRERWPEALRAYLLQKYSQLEPGSAEPVPVYEFLPLGDLKPCPRVLGLRVWEAMEGAREEDLRPASVRRLVADPELGRVAKVPPRLFDAGEPPPAAPPQGGRRILRYEDD